MQNCYDNFHFNILTVPTSTPKSSNNNSNDGSSSLTPLIQLIEDKKDASSRSLNLSETSQTSTGSSQKKKKKRISLTSSLSKIFSRGKARRSIVLSHADTDGKSIASQIFMRDWTGTNFFIGQPFFTDGKFQAA